jgi:hypothetical protein
MKSFMIGVMALTVIVLTVLKFSIVVPVTINGSLKTYFRLIFCFLMLQKGYYTTLNEYLKAYRRLFFFLRIQKGDGCFC